ncbi:G1/S-specific cyclin-D2-like [Macrosteles quadrilineatus]|uniref:G1/S-specific cyclin-D2-like n=1 Tax=Macrosteles quadrilineatus TaxID=74068 RepID=UPI0023E09488|nr:G1/S-specific cyclin-D2-like [Macrosteles quadrilineatus]XP_054267935.1 G1/S-specific cyclin-D2-like [Macrosteles quadrilineatus]
MDLLCCETECECRSYADPALLNDARVLRNLLTDEDKYASGINYFECVQRELNPDMRRIVADWMWEVCEEQKCQEDVFPLSINYLDRFLSICPIKKSQLQLLGSACLLVASKLREPRPVSAETIVYYTDNSITLQDLWRWEVLVLAKLKWEISAVTAYDFVSHILARVPLDLQSCECHMVRRHAQTFIALCARDYKFCRYTASMISAASVAAALHGLDWTSKNNVPLPELLLRLQRILHIEMDYLQSCLSQIEEMVTSAISNTKLSSEPSVERPPVVDQSEKLLEQPQPQHAAQHAKAETPTDVRDIHF